MKQEASAMLVHVAAADAMIMMGLIMMVLIFDAQIHNNKISPSTGASSHRTRSSRAMHHSNSELSPPGMNELEWDLGSMNFPCSPPVAATSLHSELGDD